MPPVVAELPDTQLTRKMSAEEFEIDSQPNIAEMLIKKNENLESDCYNYLSFRCRVLLTMMTYFKLTTHYWMLIKKLKS